ncbi:NHL repeat-containing protein, partial [Candidatus Margulisiibacteriota bacterium]
MRKIGLIIFFLFILTSYANAMSTPPEPAPFEPVDIKIEHLGTFGFAGAGHEQFFHPLAIDLANFGDISTDIGHIFAADSGNNRIVRIDRHGGVVFQFGQFGQAEGEFNNPSGIAVDFNHLIYVSDQENNRIQKFDIRGNPLTVWGSFGNDHGQFQDPKGLALDNWGNVYVADSGNDRIQKFDAN